MRRIKFRAWDKTLEEMKEVVSVNFKNKDMFLKEDDFHWIGANFFEVEILQYTEINDVFGNEIYEADVVSVIEPLVGGRERNLIGIVKFYDGSWWVDNEREAMLLFDECNDVEVLGNIYENKDLIYRYSLHKSDVI